MIRQYWKVVMVIFKGIDHLRRRSVSVGVKKRLEIAPRNPFGSVLGSLASLAGGCFCSVFAVG